MSGPFVCLLREDRCTVVDVASERLHRRAVEAVAAGLDPASSSGFSAFGAS